MSRNSGQWAVGSRVEFSTAVAVRELGSPVQGEPRAPAKAAVLKIERLVLKNEA